MIDQKKFDVRAFNVREFNVREFNESSESSMNTTKKVSHNLRPLLVAAALAMSAVWSGVPGSNVAVVHAAPKTGVQYGKAWQTGSLPKGVSKKTVDNLANAAIGPRSNRERVRSVVIVKSDASGDKIVYEKYHSLDKRDQAHDTMSISKSITSALIGMLVGDGKLTLDQKAPVAAWSDPADPRNAITIRNLLNMSTGLEWTEDYFSPESSTLAMLRAPNASAYAASLPLSVPPGTQFEYNSGNTAILMGIVTDTIGGVAATDAFIKTRFLDPLGIKSAQFQRDPSGRIVGFMGINMSSRDLARFGLLYLNDGVWGGKRLLPDGWVGFSRTLAPTSDKYAGHWWKYQDAFEAEGFYGQFVLVSNSKKLIIVITTATEGRAAVQWPKATGLRDALYALFPAA